MIRANFLSDRNKLQVEKWNSGPLENVERTIHEMIWDTVQSSPNEEAVCSWDGSFSYQELDQHASQLAWHLVELGIGPEVIVPLSFDKSKWNVVAMLGTLYAGGACKSTLVWCSVVAFVQPCMWFRFRSPGCHPSPSSRQTLLPRMHCAALAHAKRKTDAWQSYRSILHIPKSAFSIWSNLAVLEHFSALESTLNR